MRPSRYIAAVFAAIACGAASAATTVRLAPWACDTLADRILRSGFEVDENLPTSPSNGSGGAGPGNVSLFYDIAGLGSGEQAAHLHIPTRYTPARAWPLVIVMHGAAGPGWADSEATRARGAWQDVGYLHGAIIAAPVGNDTQNGSWRVPPANPNDYQFIDRIVTDVEALYNVDRSRIYLWGYSAGGHVAHDLIVNNPQASLGREHVAAYAASAGRLFGLACQGLTETACQNRLNTQPRQVPFDLHLGDSDPMGAPPYNAGLDIGRLQNAGWVSGDTLNYVQFSGGHDYTSAHAQQIWQFMCRFAVVP
jgi:poly(3-hydroxybutyrate) depolymerase